MKVCSKDGAVLWSKTVGDPVQKPEQTLMFMNNETHKKFYSSIPDYHEDIPQVLEKCFAAMKKKLKY
jgi:hypothetical protein